MGIEAAVGNFLFRSKYSAWLWDHSTSSSFHLIRVIGAVLISAILVLRSANLFIYTKLTGKPVLGFLLIGTVWAGPVKTLIAGSIVGLGYLLWQQLKQPGSNAGHRAGGKSFQGALPENTLEALRNLIAADRKGSITDLHYVEFDVHETKDGELIILHDWASFINASKTSPLNTKAVQDLESSGYAVDQLSIKDLSLAQVKSIHIGGHKGIHAPTLAEFLNCCKQEGLQHSIAAEVKSLVTDAGRQKFLNLLSTYRQDYCLELEKKCPKSKYNAFGWVAAIAFPFTWASSFGEFCGPEWKHWADEFRGQSIPVRSCVLHSLDLCPPTR